MRATTSSSSSLPGEKKLKTVASLVVSDTGLSVSAFVIRNPDENHEEVYRFLLRRNLRLPGLAYAVDKAGDVYVTGRLPAGRRRRRHPSTSCSGWCSPRPTSRSTSCSSWAS